MLALLILFTVIDIGLGVLLVMVSGVALFGLQNEGPMPGVTLFMAAMVLCFALPLAAWLLRGRLGLPAAVGIAALPVIGGLIALAPVL